MQDEKFSRYEIREALGKGGMAEVYRAYDPYFDREVALKILRREMIDDSRLRERFERETKIIAKLELEAIVPVYDIGHDQDQSFFVMRLMPGGTLAERINQGPMAPSEIIRILQRIAPALDAAHKKGIVHRDLKPGNILFDENENAYISDFGIAKSLSTSYATLTEGGVVGTPRYMSPEQARGDTVDARSDMYSLGVIVYEMLVGRTRFDSFTPLGMAFRAENSPVPPLPQTDPPFPEGLQGVLDKVMARDREQRYSTNVEFANELIAIFGGQSNTAPTPIPVTPPRLIPVPEAPTRIAPRKAQVNIFYWIAGGIVVIAVVALGVWRFASMSAAVSPTPVPATATLTMVPATEAATVVPAAIEATATPTEPATPTAVVDMGIGGANKVALMANNEIYLMNVDGSDLQALTQTDKPKYDLQWLPDGKNLLYVEAQCVYTLDTTGSEDPKQVACFDDPNFQSFRVSPDGERVAISIADRLLVMPYDPQALASVRTLAELQKMDGLCLNYDDVPVKQSLWSFGGKKLAILFRSPIYNSMGDSIRVIEGNWERCENVAVIPWDEFPGDRFNPTGYSKHPVIPSYQWDGDDRFLMNTSIRNENYGDLYLYDMFMEAARPINPIDGSCCYGSALFSPDGDYIMFVFQDVRLGSNSESQLYYIPMDQIGEGMTLTPIRLPKIFFQDRQENVQIALRPSVLP